MVFALRATFGCPNLLQADWSRTWPTWMWGMQIMQEQLSAHVPTAFVQEGCEKFLDKKKRPKPPL
jgi:hypothetical protein